MNDRAPGFRDATRYQRGAADYVLRPTVAPVQGPAAERTDASGFRAALRAARRGAAPQRGTGRETRSPRHSLATRAPDGMTSAERRYARRARFLARKRREAAEG